MTIEIRFAIPKGRMHNGVMRLLADAGVRVRATARDYRPSISLPAYSVIVLKPRAIIEMLDLGSRDLAFAGADWVAEDARELVELLDTGLDPVRLVAAAPPSILEAGRLPRRRLRVASEYANLSRRWIEANGLDAELIVSYGATEVLPPEDADCIVDNTASGATLEANNLRVIDELMSSSTRLYASRRAMDDPAKRAEIEDFTVLVKSVLEARRRVMLEVNVPADRLEAVVEILPCMREPTIAPMHGATHAGGPSGFAVKVAALREDLPRVIPLIKARGGTDIIVTKPEQIVP